MIGRSILHLQQQPSGIKAVTAAAAAADGGGSEAFAGRLVWYLHPSTLDHAQLIRRQPINAFRSLLAG
jgi:hypothetical protein